LPGNADCSLALRRRRGPGAVPGESACLRVDHLSQSRGRVVILSGVAGRFFFRPAPAGRPATQSKNLSWMYHKDRAVGQWVSGFFPPGRSGFLLQLHRHRRPAACGVRRLAAAVCRLGLPGRAATMFIMARWPGVSAFTFRFPRATPLREAPGHQKGLPGRRLVEPGSIQERFFDPSERSVPRLCLYHEDRAVGQWIVPLARFAARDWAHRD
jgi:hypothetical protein